MARRNARPPSVSPTAAAILAPTPFGTVMRFRSMPSVWRSSEKSCTVAVDFLAIRSYLHTHCFVSNVHWAGSRRTTSEHRAYTSSMAARSWPSTSNTNLNEWPGTCGTPTPGEPSQVSRHGSSHAPFDPRRSDRVVLAPSDLRPNRRSPSAKALAAVAVAQTRVLATRTCTASTSGVVWEARA